MNTRKFLWAWALVGVMTSSAGYAQESSSWTIGIGTGMKNQYVDGNIGFTSQRGAESGPIKLKPRDFNDLVYSGGGFVLTASKDRLRVNISFQRVRLVDESTTIISELLPPLTARFRQDIVQADASVNYRLAVNGRNVWGVQGGIRWTEHDYDVRIGIGPAQTHRTLDASWTDAIVAMTYTRILGQNMVWASRLGAGLGESESYYNFNSALNWQIGSHWTTSLFVDYISVDYENDASGDPFWYKYKADEWGPGLGFIYTFGSGGR